MYFFFIYALKHNFICLIGQYFACPPPDYKESYFCGSSPGALGFSHIKMYCQWSAFTPVKQQSYPTVRRLSVSTVVDPVSDNPPLCQEGKAN